MYALMYLVFMYYLLQTLHNRYSIITSPELTVHLLTYLRSSQSVAPSHFPSFTFTFTFTPISQSACLFSSQQTPSSSSCSLFMSKNRREKEGKREKPSKSGREEERDPADSSMGSTLTIHVLMYVCICTYYRIMLIPYATK